MTKKLLIKWLEQSKSKALSAVDEQRRTALKKYDEGLYEKVGLREIADKVQALFTRPTGLSRNGTPSMKSTLLPLAGIMARYMVFAMTSSADRTPLITG